MFLAESNRSGTASVNRASSHQSPASDAREGRANSGSKFLLWIDGVGGFLTCLEPDLTLGQAVPHHSVDIPILGDVSRRHLRIERVSDGYVATPIQEVRINQKPCDSQRLLADQDVVDLGSGVAIRFRQPHPLSASARLEFLSRNRLQSAADGVLLMAESCVLGPGSQSHVVCRDWRHDLVLFRRDELLHCRCGEEFTVDGAPSDGAMRLGRNSRIDGEDFSVSLEEV